MPSQETVFGVEADESPIGPQIGLNAREGRKCGANEPINEQRLTEEEAIKEGAHDCVQREQRRREADKRSAVTLIPRLNMTADTLHTTVKKECHRKAEGRLGRLLNAFAFFSICSLTDGEGEVGEGLYEAADDDRNEEYVHIHGAEGTYEELREEL